MYIQTRQHPSGKWFATAYGANSPSEDGTDITLFQLAPLYDTAEAAVVAAEKFAIADPHLAFREGDAVEVDLHD